MSEADKEMIMKARPNLKPNTIKMYLFNLNKLKKTFSQEDLKFLSDVEEVTDKIKHLHFTTQRNFYNAIIVYLRAKDPDNKDIDKYDKIRNLLNEQYKTENDKGTISTKQSDNFVDIDVLHGMLKKMEQEIKDQKLKKKESLSPKEKTLIQVFTIYSILLKIPLRNDLAGMSVISKTQYNKLSQKEKEDGNYLVNYKNKLEFVLNEYKTSKKYNEKIISIDKDLEKIIRMYLRKNEGSVLFTSSTGKPYTRNALSQLLLKTSQKYLGKNISTTMIRKIVLSDLFADNKKKQEEMAEITGHSVSTMNNVYVKEKVEE
tara:strand:+ start:5056 stop:6003 length:948 start_codon:yes stop_codon:yes gene_type:complete